MQLKADNIQDKYGTAMAGASVLITLAAGGALPALYSDNGITPTANPIIADEEGEFTFYAANGRYTLTATGTGIRTAIVRNFELADGLEIVDAVTALAGGATADAAATAADREQTGLDRAAVSTDKTATLDAASAAEISAAAALARSTAAALSEVNAAGSENNAAASASTAQGIATTFGNVQGAVDAASGSAGQAATSAGTAATQAGISTTQAGQAAEAKTAAELARDASFALGPKYATEALGRAAVADGVAFLVQGAGDGAAYEYRRVNAGTVSTLIATYPSLAAAQKGMRAKAIAEFGSTSAVYGKATPFALEFSSVAGRAQHNGVALGAGYLGEIRLNIVSVGNGALDLVLLTGASLTSQAVVWRKSVVVIATGEVVLYPGVDFDPQAVTAGWYLGFYVPTGGACPAYVSGGSRYQLLADPGAVGAAAQTYTANGQTLQMQASIVQTPAAVEAAARALDTQDGHRALSSSRAQAPAAIYGITPVTVASAGTGDARATIGYGSPVLLGGVVDEVTLWIRSIGTGAIDLIFCETTATGSFAVKRRVSVVVTRTGEVTFTAGKDFSAFTVNAISYIGIYTPAGGAQGAVEYAGAGYVYIGDPGAVGDAAKAYSGSAVRLQIRYSVAPARISSMYPWQGQSFVACGDSIVFQALWVTAFRERTGMTLAANYGSNGQLLTTMADLLTVGNMAGVGVALFGSGVNEWHHGSSTIGTPADSAATNTVYGAIRNLVEKTHAANASTVPVFWGPFNSGVYTTGPAYGANNPNGINIANLTLAMEDACGRLGAPFFATQRFSGVNDLNLVSLMPDNLHPAQPLATRHGNQLATFVNRLHPR